MWKLIELFNTSDARSILIDESSEVDPEELVVASEEILKEWGRLKDSNFYENHIRDKELYNYKKLERKALSVLAFSVTYKFTDKANEIIELFKFKIKPDIKEIERRIKLLNNWFRLHDEKNGNEEKDIIIWEDLKAEVEYQLGYQIDYNCTAIQYLSYEKIIKRIAEARRKHVKED